MKLLSVLLSYLAVLCLASFVKGIDDGSIGKNTFRGQKGVFYVLSNNAIFVIDPATQTIVKEITADHQNNALPEAANWGDVVVTDDNMLFANDRTPGADTIIVVDTILHEVIDRLDAGPRPVHLYYLSYRREVWAHNDEDGSFSVIHIDAHNRIHRDRVKAHLENPGHGKLLFHEDLGRFAWKTNVNEPGVHKFDLLKYEYVKDHSLHFGDKWCNGTHSLAYSNHNGFAYFQCSAGDRGTAIFDVGREEVVGFYSDLTGSCFTSPDQEFIACLETGRDEVHILEININGETIRDVVLTVEGGPSRVAFVQDDKLGYILWFGLRGPRQGNVDDIVTGVSYIVWNDVIAADRRTAVNIPGGTVPTNSRSKVIILGGDFIAAAADIQSKVEIFDAYNMKKVGEVAGIPTTNRLVFAPAKEEVADPAPSQPSIPDSLVESLDKMDTTLAQISKSLDSSSENSFASMVQAKFESLAETQTLPYSDNEPFDGSVLVGLTITVLVVCMIMLMVLVLLVYVTYSMGPKPVGTKSFSNEMN